MLLKPLERAQSDRDTVHATIAGIDISHNAREGRSSISPSVEGQYEPIRSAYAIAGVDPATVNYIEAHGTATDFNDAAEIAAYKKFFNASLDEETLKRYRCTISTYAFNSSGCPIRLQ